MANPLKDWEHGKKKAEETRRSIPLQRAPEWLEEKKLWRALLSKRVDDTGVPHLKGKFFHWEGTLYECQSQETIADQKVLSELNARYPHGERRVYFWVYMDEIDPRLALSLARSKS
jgi:hypothetical protein